MLFRDFSEMSDNADVV